VNLVEVYVTVTGRNGEPLTGLSASDFRVSEDGQLQAITTFAAGEVPLAVAVAVDRSFSMAGERLALAKSAAREFIAALGPDDEVTVLAVGSEVEPLVRAVAARTASTIRWDTVDAWGTTRLYDATMIALDAVAGRRGRRALVIVSDGVDRDSQASATELIGRARRSDVLVYPLTIARSAVPVLVELASVTGGRASIVPDEGRVHSTVASIARELRLQYLLGYVPARPATGPEEWRAIDVTVDRAGARVRARDGYLTGGR
jgi:Ca-activated chloride channel family protein